MRTTDPSRMTHEEILAELGEILATGYQRHIAKEMRHLDEPDNPENCLDDQFASEAACGGPKEDSP